MATLPSPIPLRYKHPTLHITSSFWGDLFSHKLNELKLSEELLWSLPYNFQCQGVNGKALRDAEGVQGRAEPGLLNLHTLR